VPRISVVVNADEYPHVPSERPDWRESYYFNFVDQESGVSGFTTIGLLPKLKKREFVFALFHDDKRELHYLEPEGPVPDDFAESLISAAEAGPLGAVTSSNPDMLTASSSYQAVAA
jgi:hypothetical protein